MKELLSGLIGPVTGIINKVVPDKDLDVFNCFMTLPLEAMTSQATAPAATVTGGVTGAFAVWLGHEK